MKATFFAFFALLAASSPVLALGIAEGFETDHVVFYLPEEVMEARVGSVGDFVNYAKQLQATVGYWPSSSLQFTSTS